MSDRLEFVPIKLRVANAFVGQFHRHHRPVHRAQWQHGAMLGDRLVGVSIVGRPVSRMLDDGRTVEVARVATDGTKNACSFLYGREWRAAVVMGYRRIVTYSLPSESGSSLRGAGWRLIGEAGGGSWNRASRRREDKAPTQTKLRWEVTA